MTEDDAKTKWCPMVRQPIFPVKETENFAANVCTEERYSLCIASDCMMWRWKTKMVESERGEMVKEIVHVNRCVPDPDDGRLRMYDFFPLGYCGLAGAPT